MNPKQLKYTILSLCFCVLFFSEALNAQGVGLSGKKWSVFANLDYTGSFRHGIWDAFFPEDYEEYYYYNLLDDESPSKLKDAVKLGTTIDLDYALKRNFTLGLFSSYYRGGFGAVDDNLFSKNYQAVAYGLSSKLFKTKKGAIAPLGAFIGLKFTVTDFLINYKGNPTIFGDDHYVNKTKHRAFGMGVSLGKQGILMNKTMFKVAVESNFFFNLGQGGEVYSSYDEKKFQEVLQWRQLFKLSIGVGLAPL